MLEAVAPAGFWPSCDGGSFHGLDPEGLSWKLIKYFYPRPGPPVRWSWRSRSRRNGPGIPSRSPGPTAGPPTPPSGHGQERQGRGQGQDGPGGPVLRARWRRPGRPVPGPAGEMALAAGQADAMGILHRALPALRVPLAAVADQPAPGAFQGDSAFLHGGSGGYCRSG